MATLVPMCSALAQRVAVGRVAALHEERADDRGDHADERRWRAGTSSRLDDAGVAGLLGGRCATANGGERDRRDDRADVRLEEVGAHAGDVADVVADVVGDGGRVAGVVLGDAGFDLADEVGADVGGLGVDAAADAGEQRDRRGAEAEGGEDLERVVDLEPRDEHEVRDDKAEQGEPGHGEAHDRAAAERDRERLAGPYLAASVVRALAMVATVMPTKPAPADSTAPST